MTKLSIVIPIYNRKANLHRVLASLDRQCFPRENFDIVVADDGSTDNPVEVINYFTGKFPIRYYWHQHLGMQLSRCRNEGARLAFGEAFIFLDSDIMLNPNALTHYWNIYQANPTCVISGRYDWMAPMDFSVEDVYNHWESIINEEMPRIGNPAEYKGIIGPDPRAKNVKLFDSVTPQKKYCLSFHGGNFLVPKDVYWALGGSSEKIVGHGGEDCEFAIRIQEAGHQCIFSDKVTGYHIYHDRNQERNVAEVVTNIERIARMHNLDELGIRRGDIAAGELPLVYKDGFIEYV